MVSVVGIAAMVAAAVPVGVIRARRPVVKRLLVTVLTMEAVVVLLAIVPAKQLGHVNAGTAGAVCGAIAIVALALCGYVGRGAAVATRASALPRVSPSPAIRGPIVKHDGGVIGTVQQWWRNLWH